MLPTLHKYNKYCSALIRSIRHEGVDLQFMLKETRVLPLVALIRAAGLPQIIHLHWIDVYTIKPTWLRSLVATATYILYLLIIRILGIKIVWTIHDYINHNGKFAYLDIAIRRFTARLTDSIIVHTETAQTEIANLYKLSNKEKSKISVVPHRHFIEEYPNTLSQLEARQQLSIDKDIFVFGSVGYVRPYKGILQLIKAFRQIDGARVHLIIAGLPFDDSFGNAVKEAALGDSRIHLHLNFIEDENLQVFLNAANALVFPFSDSLTFREVVSKVLLDFLFIFQ